ncbi:MAG: transposase [Nitrococcus mobilis]|nr:transposase [Nitrococcus mobilis]
MSKDTRRRYSEEFKADTVDLVEEQGYGVSEAARRLGIDRSILARWRRERREQAISGSSRPKGDERDAELRQLREENRKLRIEREILKRQQPSSPTN